MSKIQVGKIHKIYLTALTLIALICLFSWKQVSAKEIILVDGDISMEIKSRARNVGELLAEQGVTLHEKDEIEPQLDERVSDGMAVKITRARDVSIIKGEQTIPVITTKSLVRDVLAQAGVETAENDKVIPGLDDTCEDTIQVIKVEKKTVIEELSLPYSTEKVAEDTLYKGEERVLQKGKKGLEQHVFEVVLENGKETARQLIKKTLVREPVKQVVATGTRQTISRGGQPLQFKEVLTMSSTGYTHTGNRTYTDIWPAAGTVAVDPTVIPLRTRLYIDGYGYATAMDIGSAIKGNRIDLFFETKKEALKWGRRTVKVFILE